MRIQLLSDLHLESEPFVPEPVPGADLLVLAGDIDSTWAGLRQFAGWPVPVVMVAGNHEFDGRDIDQAWAALRSLCGDLDIRLLERETCLIEPPGEPPVRLLGTVRWCDFDLLGAGRRSQAMRAGKYFSRVMRASRGGALWDVPSVRDEALACRAWLSQALLAAPDDPATRTVVVTHFAPSARSADPRYGTGPATASFCNADDDLLPHADLWLHGHLHCRHDWRAMHADGHSTRVVSQARGLGHKGEPEGWNAAKLIEL